MVNEEVKRVLDKGHLELVAHCGGDLSVVNSARVSFGKRVDEVSEADAKLIGFLLKNRHGTPFEHNMFTFNVKCPIFVAREWQRHRIGSYNEMSARYMQLPEDFYIPATDNVRMRVGKPGHYTYEQAGELAAAAFISELRFTCARSYGHYQTALEQDIAPEQARMFLHVNHYTEFYWTTNARSLMNFLNLRNAPTAQWEIRQYAFAVEDYFNECMPLTYGAFETNERIAP